LVWEAETFGTLEFANSIHCYRFPHKRQDKSVSYEKEMR